jgi:DinB superfamily/Pentapeptide repeats (8 copies)
VAAEYSSTDDFRGATFRDVDLAGASFRDCTLTGVRITGSDLSGLRVSGYLGSRGGVVVDDVDVTDFVRAELDRRYPERVQLREARTADELRAVWATIERLWAETRARAERLPDHLRYERVDDEWSLVETLRHLVCATDIWLGRMIRSDDRPFHPAGLLPTGFPEEGAVELGIDPTARPSYDEAVAVESGRRDRLRAFLATVTDADLEELRTAAPTPAWGERTLPVRGCLGVLLDEHVEHRRFAERDLAMLE